MDAITELKERQRKGWVHFAPLEQTTSLAAPRLVRFAGVAPGARVLDVGCGTGVVAVTAARAGAKATGLDLTPELLARARENSAIAQVDVSWHEGDAEALPFPDGSFDVVLSQFGHMFAPRPEVAMGEMLRVLRPGGTLAFSTWPPDLFMGRMFSFVGRWLPPPPPGAAPPTLWGDPAVVRQRLGDRVRDVIFSHGTIASPGLSPAHVRVGFEQTGGPVIGLVRSLAGEPERLDGFRREMEALIAAYFEDNLLRQDYLMTRAVKV